MKQIRLAVAQRYLRIYNNTGAHLECVYGQGKAPERKNYPTIFVGHLLKTGIVFTPKARVFLRREDDTDIAQIREGLPRVKGHFDPFTAEFLQEIPY